MHRVVAVNVAKGPTIMLASGKLFDFLDPHGSDFGIDDIAHGLAHVCRYAGQCRAFYSVAEHSMLVADTVSEFAYEALLHDAAEAFIGDVTRPFKQLLPDYKRIEATIEDAMIGRFGLDRRSKETRSPRSTHSSCAMSAADGSARVLRLPTQRAPNALRDSQIERMELASR
jgi:5'-deoxynucleotidase YfbR-like HD superfamily hydrolase